METKGYDIVETGTQAETMLAAQRWVNTASDGTRVFVVSKKGKPFGVALLRGIAPDGSARRYDYTPASEYGIRRQYERPAHLR